MTPDPDDAAPGSFRRGGAGLCIGCGVLTVSLAAVDQKRLPRCPECASRASREPEWWQLAVASWRRRARK